MLILAIIRISGCGQFTSLCLKLLIASCLGEIVVLENKTRDKPTHNLERKNLAISGSYLTEWII
jgi:ABC-type proline/glycine betaine transport system ATPase subunit